MKILWLHSHFLYPTGGTRFVFEVIKGLSKKHDITVAVERSSQYWLDKYQEIGVKVQVISGKSSESVIYWLLFPFYFLHDKHKISHIAKDADLIIASMFPMHAIADSLGKPYIYYCFEPFAFFYDKTIIKSTTPVKKIGSRLLSFAYQHLDKEGVLKADSVLCINQSTAAVIKEIYKRSPDAKTFLGVDTNFFKKRKISRPSKYREKLLLFHSTDFTATKGTDLLLKAMPYIISKNKDALLLISNTVENSQIEDDYHKLVKSLSLSKHVEFVGNLPYQKLPLFYSMADVVCFSGNPGGSGASLASLLVLESMACQTPVVRSNDCLEEVNNGETGYLADPRSAKIYATAVNKLLADSQLRIKMGKAARARILKYFTWPRVINIFEKEIAKYERR